MSDEIRADYEHLEQVSARMLGQSKAVHELLNMVRSRMDPLESGSWIGRGSDAFFAEMNGEVLPASQRLQQALEEAGQVTRQIAQTMRQAEEEASSPFRV